MTKVTLASITYIATQVSNSDLYYIALSRCWLIMQYIYRFTLPYPLLYSPGPIWPGQWLIIIKISTVVYPAMLNQCFWHLIFSMVCSTNNWHLCSSKFVVHNFIMTCSLSWFNSPKVIILADDLKNHWLGLLPQHEHPGRFSQKQ